MVKKAYIAPEALFLSLAVEDNTNFNIEKDDVSGNLDFGDIGDLFD